MPPRRFLSVEECARCALFGIVATLMAFSFPKPGMAEVDIPDRAHAIYEAAETACKLLYGENHLTAEEQSTLKYYCQRVQHPVEFMQDQDWWRNNAPAMLQAAPSEKDFIDTLVRQQIQKERCLANGGSEFICALCPPDVGGTNIYKECGPIQ